MSVALLLTPDPPAAAAALEAVAAALASFVRELSGSIIDSFSTPLYWIAAVAACLAICASLATTITEERSSDARPLMAWLFRLALSAFLLVSSAGILSLADAGRRDLTALSTPLVVAARDSFQSSFTKFTETSFTDGKKEERSAPVWDPQSPWYRNADRLLNPNSWSPARLYAVLTVARAALSASDMVARVIWAIILLVLTLCAPVMAAVVPDKRLAKRLASPYAWSIVIAYFIWPVTSDVLSAAGYTMASYTLSAFTAAPAAASGAAPASGPDGYAVTACALLTLIAALMQFTSMGLAYRLSRGQVFEAVGASAFNWLGSLAATAIEYFGIRASSDMEMVGRMSEVEGGYKSSMTVAKYNRDASYAQAAGAREGGSLSARAGLYSQTAMADARRQLSLDTNMALRDANVRLLNNSTSYKLNEVETSRTARLAEIGAGLGRELNELGIEEDSAKRRNVADTAAQAWTEVVGGASETITKAIVAVATGGAGAAAVEAAEVGEAAGAADGAGVAETAESVNATYGASQTVPGLPQVRGIELPGISQGRLVGEQPLAPDSIESPTLDNDQIRKASEKVNTSGSTLATLALGTFNLYNTKRVAGEHVRNVNDYSDRITGIINERADKMRGFTRDQGREAVRIYGERGASLDAAQNRAADTRIGGVERAHDLQVEAAGHTYAATTEAAGLRNEGQHLSAETRRDASLDALEAKREATLLRELTKDFSRRVNSNLLRL